MAQAKNDHESVLESFDERLENLKTQVQEIDQINAEIASRETTIKQSATSTLQSKGSQKQQTIRELAQKIGVIEDKLDTLDSQKENHLVCPGCETALLLTNGALTAFSLEVLEEEVGALEAELEKLEATTEKLEAEVTKINLKLKIINKAETELVQYKSRLVRLEEVPSKIEVLEEKIKDRVKDYKKTLSQWIQKKLKLELRVKKYGGTKKLDTYEDLLVSIETKGKHIVVQQDQSSRLVLRIETIMGLLEDKKQLLKDMEGELEELAKYKFWVLGFPEIRKWMIDSFLPAFEEQTNVFLDRLEVGMRVRFDTEKEKKSGKEGEMKSAFDLSIVDNNSQIRELESFSGGEVKRIGVCVGFALRELTLNKGYNAFDFLLMDEVIDSLDETGIGEFFQLMTTITGTKFMITHNTDLKTRFTNVIRVVKTDGSSTIYQS